MDPDEVLAYLLSASRQDGLGPIRLAAARERHGGYGALARAARDGTVAADRAPLREALLAAARPAERKRAHRDLDAWRRDGLVLLHPESDAYPPSLAAIPDPPPVLYLRGALPASLYGPPGRPDAVAVVGTRAGSPWAIAFAGRLAHRLAEAGLTVVSGLALGVDGAAHRGALEADPAGTVAVLGSGPDRIHPRTHEALAARIVAGGGALVSERPPGAQAMPGAFPRRNRIIAGLARGTVVVEAPPRSGARHTLEAALEQGRDVWVVPRRPDSDVGRAAYAWLRDGAAPLADADDVLRLYRPDGTAPRGGPRPEAPDSVGATDAARAAEDRILDRLRALGSAHVDTLLDGGTPVASGLAALARLQRAGRVARLDGDRWHATERRS